MIAIPGADDCNSLHILGRYTINALAVRLTAKFGDLQIRKCGEQLLARL